LADEKTARLPVLMMSGDGQGTHAAAAEFRNTVATLAKPFLSSNPIELVQATLATPPVFENKARTPAEEPTITPPLLLDAGQLDGVDLDTRGQIETLRSRPPTSGSSPSCRGQRSASVTSMGFVRTGVRQCSWSEQTCTHANAAARPFELAEVELTPSFAVAHLVLRWRGGKRRVTQQPELAKSGAIFAAVQVRLDRSADIAELFI
jgi:hypothetical protein